MPDTAGLLTVAAVAVGLAVLLLAAALFLKKSRGGLTKPLRGVLLAAALCAICGVGVAMVAGVLAVGPDLGWF